ncbi:MAG: hypothetical protein MJ185_03360 [Treponema sp.]|nr:hypothetical protein [Treponema sp.]
MANTTSEIRTTLKYKDRLFRAIFNDKEHKDWLLSLYNAVNDSNYTNEKDLEITTLEDVIYMKMKNDISFILNNQMSLYEHQSTYSPNLPLRGLMYFSELLRVKYHNSKIYSNSKIKIATPNYIVFYNGEKDIGERMVLKLSDSFEIPVRKTDECYEWTCTVLNINKGKNEKLVKSCKALQDYVEYVTMVKENLRAGKDLESAVETALDEAVKKRFLNGYFDQHRARIKAMSLTEYDEEEAKKVFHDDGYREGAAAQRAEDEILIKQKEVELEEKKAALEEKDAALEEKDAEIARLKALLAGK